MKSSWRSPDGGSSVARNTKIEPSEAVFCAWWGTASTPIRTFHTVSEVDFYEVRRHGVLRSSALQARRWQSSRDPVAQQTFALATHRSVCRGDVVHYVRGWGDLTYFPARRG